MSQVLNFGEGSLVRNPHQEIISLVYDDGYFKLENLGSHVNSYRDGFRVNPDCRVCESPYEAVTDLEILRYYSNLGQRTYLIDGFFKVKNMQFSLEERLCKDGYAGLSCASILSLIFDDRFKRFLPWFQRGYLNTDRLPDFIVSKGDIKGEVDIDENMMSATLRGGKYYFTFGYIQVRDETFPEKAYSLFSYDDKNKRQLYYNGINSLYLFEDFLESSHTFSDNNGI